MPSRFKTVCKSFRQKMGRKVESVIPIDREWTHQQVYVRLPNSGHMGVDRKGGKPTLAVFDGSQHPEIDTFNLSTKDVMVKDRVVTLCFFSHMIDEVTYYVTSNDTLVTLQKFQNEPDATEDDSRLFEVSMNKKWCQFRSFGSSGLYICYDKPEFCLKKQTSPERTQFNFDIIQR